MGGFFVRSITTSSLTVRVTLHFPLVCELVMLFSVVFLIVLPKSAKATASIRQLFPAPLELLGRVSLLTPTTRTSSEKSSKSTVASLTDKKFSIVTVLSFINKLLFIFNIELITRTHSIFKYKRVINLVECH